jgi:hypothetical protein
MAGGITSDTPTNLVIGAGAIYRNQDPFGASMDDNVFRIERELITAELNGIKGHLKGTTYVRRSEGILETAIPEISATVLASTWPGSTSDTATEFGASATVIDEDDTRRLPDTAYADWELQVERLNGGEFQFEVDNAINMGTIEATLADGDFARPRLELHGMWDADDGATISPHRIRVLDTAS